MGPEVVLLSRGRPGPRAFAALLAACTIPAAARAVTVRGRGIELEFDARLHSRVVAVREGTRIEVGPFSASETVFAADGERLDFAFAEHGEEPFSDGIGAGRRHRLVGRGRDLQKTLEIVFYDDWPDVAVFRTVYENLGPQSVAIQTWTQNRYAIAAPADRGEPAFWSYQSGSYERRPDWVLPLPNGFRQENFLGMNSTDYGGGTPVVDVWRRDVGLAVGHLELTPRSVYLPVSRQTRDRAATLGVRAVVGRTLAPGERLTTLRTFVAVHRGDHFQALVVYRRLMLRQGIRLPTAPPSAFEPIWCAWGYGRGFTTEQVLATLPLIRQLGFGWATLDDGWQVAEGEWNPAPGKFPSGDAGMKELVGRIHAAGLKAQLWWSPLAADPGSRTAREHPEWLLRNQDGSTREITWWDSRYLCPALEAVREDARAFVRKALGEWGYDGLKIDGQHLNGAPACFAAHGHASPEEASQAVPGFFQAIWEEAIATRPDAVVEICPCGTAYSFFSLPYLNMTVASDPESSWQVRLKGKTLKALHGDSIAYFGDHVELSTGGEDFASTVGVGGVVGTNFAWPGAPGKKDETLLLTRAREEKWAFWIKLYQQKRLSQGEYLGALYDIGFDRPEAHAVRKGNVLYYAFFADAFRGKVELRGLAARRYRIRDYETGRDFGSINGPQAPLEASFKGHLLLEALPE